MNNYSLAIAMALPTEYDRNWKKSSSPKPNLPGLSLSCPLGWGDSDVWQHMEAVGQSWDWGAAQNLQSYQHHCQPNAKAAARRHVPDPHLLQMGPDRWVRCVSWREKLLDYPAYRFPRCAFPRGDPRQWHPAGK